jgi:phosphoribosyl-ATP pyrophosphohydrolase
MNYTQEQLSHVLKELSDVIASRKNLVLEGGHTDSSYVASLFSKGDDAILKKLGEELAETIMAAKDFRHAGEATSGLPLIKEVADVWFHSLVLLAQFNLRAEHVLAELKHREGVSGIKEKASRSK